MATHHVLLARSEGILPWIELNRVAILQAADPRPVSSEIRLNRWILPGKNVLSVRLEKPEDPHPTRFWLSLVTFPAHSDPENATQVPIEFAWPPKEAQEHGEEPPIVRSFEFTPGDPPPGELWEKAAPLGPGPEPREEILILLRRLHAALSERNVGDVMEIQAFKLRDALRSHHFAHSAEIAIAEAKEVYEDAMSQHGFRMEPIMEDEVELHPVADGRVLWVTGENRQAVLRSFTTEGPRLTLPVYVARIQGRWTVVA